MKRVNATPLLCFLRDFHLPEYELPFRGKQIFADVIVNRGELAVTIEGASTLGRFGGARGSSGRNRGFVGR